MLIMPEPMRRTLTLVLLCGAFVWRGSATDVPPPLAGGAPCVGDTQVGGQCSAGDDADTGLCSASTEAAAADAGRPASKEAGSVGGEKVDGSEYIVRFNDYLMQHEQQQRLEDALSAADPARTAEGSWRWVERHNRATAHPTDFGLLRLADDGETLQALRSALKGAAFVRSITPQQRITRSLLARAMGGEGTRQQQRQQQQQQQHEEEEEAHPVKGPGRLQTKSSYEVHEEDAHAREWDAADGNLTAHHRRELLAMRGGRSITDAFQASTLWSKGYSGSKVRMAVFDTGVRQDHPHFRHIKERSNWTHEPTLDDGLGHGTFVAGVVASQSAECQGFAPEAEIYAFRVFTNDQVSYTSWFLDAFNYAIVTEMNVVNLSIGGPDYLDAPFVEKVWELTANNVIMVSAIGNDGPLYGTLNNPADQMDVIGVGGIDYQDHIASFSSRGMTTWELPHGYGRVKPDIVAYGRDVVGSKMAGGCRSLSGTSVASPVVAGAVVLLCSVIPEAKRWQLLNPAVLKQALVESARRIDGPHIHEQGAGKLNLVGAYEILKNYKPRASVVPSHYDLGSCPYMWPYCRQPLYATAMPLVLNATIVNGMGLTGWLEQPPQWFPGRNGKHLDLRFEYPKKLWPWSGYLALYVRVKEDSSKFSGTAEGTVKFEVVSPPGPGERTERRSTVTLTLRAPVIETPPRRQRLLWDNYHSVRYPPGYIPRDSLDVRQDILDWHGDHPHTNYHDMFNSLRDKGYYVEMLGSPFTCFQAENYKALLLVDSEEEYHPEERAKLTADINQRGLSLLVFADWYNVETMVKMRFFDDNTRSWWTPATGGANVPALNDLLEPWGIAFGDTVINGRFELQRRSITFASGAPLVQFPKGGLVHSFHFTEKSATKGGVVTGNRGNNYPVMGFFHPHNSPHAGKIVVHGDSNCLDSSHMAANQDGFLLLAKMLEYCETGVPDGNFFPRVSPLVEPLKPGAGWSSALPQRRTDVDFAEFSRVLNQPAVCGPDAPLQLVTPVGGGVPVVLASTDSAAEVSQGGGGHVAADNTHGAPKSVDIEALTAQKAHGATIEAHGDVDAQSTSVPQAHAAVESGRVEVQRTATPEATRGVALVAGGTTGSVYDQAPAEVDKELEEPKSEEALEENEQLQSAVVSSIVHHTSQVDPVHRAENEAFGMESTVGGLRSRVKYMMALSAGLLVGTFVGLTQALFRRKRSAASGTGKTSSRARSGRSGRSTGARGTTAALLSK